MKFSRTAAAVMALIMLTGCEPVSRRLSNGNNAQNSVSDVSGQNTAHIPETTEKPVSYTQYSVRLPEIHDTDDDILIEAEDCTLKGSLYVSEERRGYSGEGYVTGFYGGSADYIDIIAETDANCHYDITICVASNEFITSYIEVNGNRLEDFSVSNDGNFTRITFYGIYMQKGKNTVTLHSGNANLDLDYIELTSGEKMYDTEFDLFEDTSNKNSSQETKRLFQFIKNNFGNRIITGQYASDSKNKELELIYQTTGKYPAIRFGDIGGYQGNVSSMQKETEAAVEWAEKGGIVGFMWYWNAPGKNKSVYSKDSRFHLSAAVTEKDISQISIQEIENMYTNGTVTAECLELIRDIDEVSEQFKILKQKGIPVLWRPLHEAGGGWFWWGSDGAPAYKWLYTLLYKRMTEYHKLNNLIWVWNGQNEDYLVDSSLYDIAAIDIYLSPDINFGSRSEQYLWLKLITGNGKPLAISECSAVPSIDYMCRDKTLWSFFGLWFGDYLTDQNGNLSEIYTKKSELIKMYNADKTITLEDCQNFVN